MSRAAWERPGRRVLHPSPPEKLRYFLGYFRPNETVALNENGEHAETNEIQFYRVDRFRKIAFVEDVFQLYPGPRDGHINNRPGPRAPDGLSFDRREPLSRKRRHDNDNLVTHELRPFSRFERNRFGRFYLRVSFARAERFRAPVAFRFSFFITQITGPTPVHGTNTVAARDRSRPAE